ncbi:MAG: hypothetical protein IT269_09515 [Saprospiraceae bacterium]|nr:hypothetical protein [Saprospiraceae bacterium]
MLKLVVRDPNARKSFGKIEKNAPVTLYFMNGSSMIIHNLQTSEGSPDAEAQTVTYQAVYTLEDDALKVFRKSELDRIRVSWMTGYEDYEVQQVDVLQALLRCL